MFDYILRFVVERLVEDFNRNAAGRLLVRVGGNEGILRIPWNTASQL